MLAIKSKKPLSETQQKVSDYLESQGVVFSVHYCGVSTPWDNKQEYDAWYATFDGESFDFHTGMGHREYPKGFVPKKYYNPRCIAAVAQESQKKPVFPCAASVLYCLVADSEARDMCFEDWAETLGIDPDSRKAFDVYDACCKSGKKLMKVFSHAQIQTLRDMLQDY